eukprot:CAMPEP_0114306570 /NCGR_PEP_ID=MMETSP0059-20121206/16977_1 /TAXON_ID=36894 /ORGANISM="Pyramimonas parkeae, Strain CCMP726" /LENGTH=253 /DNA_ID=CAMNT_0001429917 /DNA_START=103 /DNA_END=864 /DNA_ORIENTATION=+
MPRVPLLTLTTLISLFTNDERCDAVVLEQTTKFQECIANPSSCTHLFLDNSNLTGTLPDALSSLTQLTSLWIEDSQLGGKLPDALSANVELQELAICNSRLTGTIPDAALSALVNLRVLYLHNNSLTGSIPASLNNMKKLVTLRVDNNRLTGVIPSSLADLTNMVDLYVCGNAGLCGDLPLGVAPDSSPFYDVCPFGAISGTMLELPCADFETLRTQTLQQMSDYVSTGMVWAKSFERMVRNMVDFVMKVIKV